MKIQKKYIYDLVLRLTHAGLALFCLILILSAYAAKFFSDEGIYRKSLWVTHIFAGHALIGFFLLRIIWGFIGPKHARWSSLIQIAEWKKIIREKNFLHIKWKWGHHPLASIAYLGFYFVLLGLAISGLMLAAIEHNIGPWANQYFDNMLIKHDFEELHEALAMMINVFIVTHLFALIWHEKADEIPVAQSMISGNQYRKEESENENN